MGAERCPGNVENGRPVQAGSRRTPFTSARTQGDTGELSVDGRLSSQEELIDRQNEEDSTARCGPRSGGSFGVVAQHQYLPLLAFGAYFGQWLDGRGFILCIIRPSDHRNFARLEEIGWLFQEFLCKTLFANLATVLLGADFHVRGRAIAAPLRSSCDFRGAFVAVVGLSVLSAEFPGSNPEFGHRSPRRDVVARGGGTVLPSVASGGAILFGSPPSPDCRYHNLPVPGFTFLCVAAPRRYLLKYVLPSRWPHGRGATGNPHPFRQFCSIQVCGAGLDHVACVRPPRGCDRYSSQREMDRVFCGRGRVGFVCVHRSLLSAEGGACSSDKPVPGLNGYD